MIALSFTVGGFHWHNKECERARRRARVKRQRANGRLASYKKHKGTHCVFCSATENLTVDHILPMYFGGQNCPDNYWTVCQHCHNLKTISENKIIAQIRPRST